MIDKSIRQHYAIQDSKRRRFLHGSQGPSATPDVAPSGGGEGPQGPPSIISRPAPVVTTAVAPPSILARDTPTIPTVEAPPGEKFGPGYISPEDLQTQEIKNLIAKQQEEKYGDTADPTKFGETISKLDVAMSKEEGNRTIDDKLAIEDWEKDQDWEKVEELADRGESSEDIQNAMNKGLLLKEDAIRRKGLIERGLAAVMPKTKLESSLMGSLKKTFDPKRLAMNFAMKKMGLSWLNPLMGLASLFFPKQTATVKSKFGLGKKQPTDMSAFKNLGLYADRQPTDTTKYARVGETYRQPDLTKQIAGKGDVISKSIAKFTGKGDDLSGIEGQQAVLGKAPLIQMRMLERKIKAPDIYGKPTPKEERMYKKLREMDKEEKVYKLPILTAADGGRIDRALAGRNRYI